MPRSLALSIAKECMKIGDSGQGTETSEFVEHGLKIIRLHGTKLNDSIRLKIKTNNIKMMSTEIKEVVEYI